jgi:ArsR family transcriptional regulator, arsenate/arsenite/antimonite-responsive transcriptional repressor
MAVNKQLVALENVLKALADRTRLRIVGLLGAGEICVCHIHESLGIPQPTASRHLAYLRRAGLVEGRKEGLWVHYRLAKLDDPVLQAVLDSAAHAVGHLGAAERDLRRLSTKVELPAIPRVMPISSSCCAPSPERT